MIRLIKWLIGKIKSERKREAILHWALMNNPERPLTKEQADLVISLYRKVKRANSFILERELRAMLKQWERNKKED